MTCYETVLANLDLRDMTDRAIVADLADDAGWPEDARLLRSPKRLRLIAGVLCGERNIYYASYPRAFGNEYTVYVLPYVFHSRFKRALPGLSRVSRDAGVWLGWSRPRQARRDQEQWYGGFCTDPVVYCFPATLAEAIAAAVEATANVLLEKEYLREASEQM